MFVPSKTTERFDRTLFDGTGKPATLSPKTGFAVLRYYFKTDKIVGMITGLTQALTYERFSREGWCPVEIVSGSESYCGWIDLANVAIK